jgi:hypothetical protein
MFISRKELQELREEIAMLKESSSFRVFDKPGGGYEGCYEPAHRISNSKAIQMLARHDGLRFYLERGPGDHAVLDPVEVKND